MKFSALFLVGLLSQSFTSEASTTICGAWYQAGNSCPTGSYKREDSDGHTPNHGGAANADECCYYMCKDHFKGTCPAGSVLRGEAKYYKFQFPPEKVIPWATLNVVAESSCCEEKCTSTTNKATCASDESLKNERCVNFEGAPTKKLDTCKDASKCCEKTSCVHSTCNTLTGGFDVACKKDGKCVTECVFSKVATLAEFQKCADCTKWTGCFECLQCYAGLYNVAGTLKKPDDHQDHDHSAALHNVNMERFLGVLGSTIVITIFVLCN